MNKFKLDTLKNVLKNLKTEIIQDVPNQLSECEICRKTECSDDKWIKCEKRIAHMKCLEEIAKR